MDVAAFYRRLEDMRTLPTSSQPSVESMLEAFRRALERGSDVLGVFISADMSGTCQTARMAADMLAEEYPAGRIEILDSRSNSMEEGYAVLAAAARGQCRRLDRAMHRRRHRDAAAHALPVHPAHAGVPAPWRADRGRLGAHRRAAADQADPHRRGRGDADVRAREDAGARARRDDRASSQMTRGSSASRTCASTTSATPRPPRSYAHEQIEPLAGGEVRVIPVSPVIGLHVGPAVGLVYTTERDWA